MDKVRAFEAEELLSLDTRYRANLINSLIGFKPVQLLGTKNLAGETNVAPFSQIVHLGANPALVGVVFRPETVARHTLENIRSTGWVTFNHIRKDFLNEAHLSSAKWEGSEFESCGLTEFYREGIEAPFVAEALVQSAGTPLSEYPIEENGTLLLVVRIEGIWVPESIVGDDGYLSIEKAGTLCSSGLDGYHSTSLLERLPYARPTLKK